MMTTGAVLITGGAGYIGSHTAYACLDAGRPVVVLDNLSTGRRELVPERAVFAQGSIDDPVLVQRLIRENGVSAVIHFAAKTVVPDSVADPGSYYSTNFAGALSLVQALLAEEVKTLVFSSTAAVYDPAAALTRDVVENDPTVPMSPYGWSKLMVERLLADMAAAHGLNYAVLRYFNVAGADPLGRTGQSTPRATHLIKAACEVAVGKRDALDLYGDDYPTPDGSCVRDYIHVTDLADAHLLALRHLESGGEPVTLNCGYGQGTSVLEVVRALEKVLGQSLPVRMAPRRPGDPPRIVSNPNKLRTLFGWTPKHDDLEEIVGSALAWERKRAGQG